MTTNRRHGSIYIGVTSNLVQRINQHKLKRTKGFCSQYNLDKLVWFQQHLEMYQALAREKQLKNWKRLWKIELIESENPSWEDLYPQIVQS